MASLMSPSNVGSTDIMGDQFVFYVVGHTMEENGYQSCRVPVAQTSLDAEVDGVVSHHLVPMLHVY